MKTGLKMLIAAMLFTLPFTIASGAEGTLIGGTPYEGFEDGGNDFFVMFNSLIDDQVTLYSETTNRQADTCLLESSFTLNSIHTPDDAQITKAYLVWMGAVDPANFAAPTDNAVHLKFSHYQSGYLYEEDVIAGDTAKNLGDTSNTFEFQSVQFNTDITTGCTETNPGQASTGDVAYFTYRKDVTSFFQKIFDDNRAADNPLLDGEALYGTYTVSGLDCTNHDNYKCRTTMVSNWSVFFVYKSGKIRSKKIYLYPGFAYAQGEASTANVSGFFLPKNPVLRLTTMIAEGDPALVKPELPPELIYIKGAEATSTYQLTNECNPLEGMSYEIYNSKSSIIGWDPEDESVMCVTGGTEGQYYGIDADTFLLDSEDDINLQEHLKLGGTSLDVTLSVNQDAILMNYLVVSVDTKSPAFDIPPEASKWPEDREKHFCSCRKDEDKADSYCHVRPMYYLIKVQNWGTNVANNVTVIDNIDPRVDYVPGSTEMAWKFDENGNGICWEKIEDKAEAGNAACPLSGDGYKVADTMDICNQANWTCTDTRLIRFKVIPKDLPKNEVIPNIAIIKEAGSSDEYRSNKNFDLSLHKGTCLELAACQAPEKIVCGGINDPTDPECTGEEPECDDTHPCPEGYVCDTKTDTQYTEDNFKCKADKNKTCSNAKVSYDLGTNTPDSEGTKIIVPSGTQDLVLGQFKMNAANCAQTKFYNFVSLRLKLEKDDPQVKVENLELVYDKNGSGSVDPEDEVIGSVTTLDSTGAYFAIDETKNRFAGNEWHHIIIQGDVGYNVATIPGGASFKIVIENKNSFAFEDTGNAQPDGDPIDFADFLIEPTTNFFIVTKGAHDPSVPAACDLYKPVPMLQLRTKALDASNRIRRITVNIPSDDEYVRFGKKGIRSLALYTDAGGDGVELINESLPIAKISTFEDDGEAVFEGEALESVLDYDSGEEIFLLVVADLSGMPKTGMAKLEIKRGGVVVQNTTKKVEGLPVSSKTFLESSEIPCETPDDDGKDDDECTCTMVTVDGGPTGAATILLALALLALVGLRPRRQS